MTTLHRPRARVWGGVVLLATAAGLPSDLRAQPTEPAGFPVERLWPAMDHSGILDVESGDVGTDLEYDLSLWGLYGFNPLVLYQDSGGTARRVGSLVRHRVGVELISAIGLFERAKVAVAVPVTLYQSRDSFDHGGVQFANLRAAGVGDVRWVPKIRLLRRHHHGVDLALIPTFTLPTGYPKDRYLGEKGMTFVPALAASRHLGSLRLAVNLGYRYRSTTRTQRLQVGQELLYRMGVAYDAERRTDRPVQIGVSLSGSTSTNRPFRRLNRTPTEVLVGGTYALTDSWQVSAGVGAGLIPGYGTPDFRVLAGLRYAVRTNDDDGDGVANPTDACVFEPEDFDDFEDADGCPDPDNDGDGIADIDDAAPMEPEDFDDFEDGDGKPELDNDEDNVVDTDDQCPLVPETHNGYEDEDGCPDEVPDTDGDGLRDNEDECVEEPEDGDGFEDEDGCPDLDNDEDGVIDARDGCPMEPGPVEGFGCPDTDRDGDTVVDRLDNCPDEAGDPQFQGCANPQLVKLTAARIEISEKIYFDTGNAFIQKRSHGVLDDVAAVLKAHPRLHVRIEGHTDSQGGAELNKILSQKRAEAVREFLVGKGVDGSRLEAVGFGESQPLARNSTKRGRATNRRVEFTIVRQDEPQRGAAEPNEAAVDPSTEPLP